MNTEIDEELTDIQMENGFEIGEAAAFALFDIDSDTVDSDSAILSCLTTCITQLALRGWTKENLIDEVGTYCTVAEGLQAEWDEEEAQQKGVDSTP